MTLDYTFYLSAVRTLLRISKINWYNYVSPKDGYLTSTRTWHHDIYTPSLAAQTSTCQYTTDIRAPCEIQTQDFSRRVTADR